MTTDTGKPDDADPRQAILGDPLFREFAGDVTKRLTRLETAGMMPESVALRADLWPQLVEWNGYPVVRLVGSTDTLWAVLA